MKWFSRLQTNTKIGLVCTLLVGMPLLFAAGWTQPADAGPLECSDAECDQVGQSKAGCEADGGRWRAEEGYCYYPDPAQEGNPNYLVDKYLLPFIRFLSAVVGLVVTISIVMGGIQYASAGSDPQKVAKAKGRITNSLVALLAYLFLYAFLEWIIPGGFLD